MAPRLPRSLWLLLLALLTACSETELVGLHIALAKDGSGTLTARALQAANSPGPAEARARGVQWQTRANLMSSQGTFRSLADLAFGDGELRFLSRKDEVDLPHLRLILRRGPELSWVQALVPDQETRRTLAKVHDPTGKTREIADTIRIEVQVPDAVVSSGVQPAGRGIEATHERNRAYLILPVQTITERGDDLVWDVSWK
jgi:hypothetical protein